MTFIFYFEQQAEHNKENNAMLGVDGIKGTIADMKDLGIWDTYQVKTQTIKTAIESACMLLRIDDIVSGMQQAQKQTFFLLGLRFCLLNQNSFDCLFKRVSEILFIINYTCVFDVQWLTTTNTY